MKIAMVGCGKLGLPCALAASSKGHDVVGYDTSPLAKEILASRRYPHREDGAQDLLNETTMRIVDTIDEAVSHADIVFVAVQTPHRPEFEGITAMPEHRADFDYSALKTAVSAVAIAAEEQKKSISVVVISTALPGTCEREVFPLLNEYTGFVYNPFFIAMGTTIADYLKPEMVLIGYDPLVKFAALERVGEFYRTIHDSDHVVMSVASAELTKVAYNVFLGLKIVAANAIMEIAHKIGGKCNCDDVANALAKATDRVVSSKYMRGGMGDGGGCHPRDQIALSWLARKLDLSYDLFGAMVEARECQTAWLADLCFTESQYNKQIIVLGKAYKKGTNLTIGSPAILLRNILNDSTMSPKISSWDPHVDAPRTFSDPAVFLIGTDHNEFFSKEFADSIPKGSTVIDPWGKLSDIDGVKVVRTGRN